MHILLIHQAFAAIDEPGGTRHHELARFLVGNGHRVTVIASPVSYLTGGSTHTQNAEISTANIEENITILRAHTYQALHKSFIHRVFAFFSFMITSFFLGLRVRNVDLVWGTSPPIFQGWTAWMLARLKGAPFLFEVRDLWPEFAIAVGVLKNPTLIKMSLWLEKFLYRHADKVVVNSPGFLDHVTIRGARTVELIPNGADPEMFTPTDMGVSFRRAHHLEESFVVMYAGAHGLSNDLGVVLAAADILRAKPEVKIIFLGDGKEKTSLVKQAELMGLSNVVFLLPVPKSEMPDSLAGANACIAILKPLDAYKTTYPNKVFDYMAAARPVVLAIDGVIREVVESAGCGIFVPPGDSSKLAEAIAFLADDVVRSHEMGLAGRRYLEQKFSRAVIAGKLLVLMEYMVTGNPATGNQ
jgi:glycosyltransferase involved in cell wall biosynthesis